MSLPHNAIYAKLLLAVIYIIVVKCVHPQKLPMIDDSLRALIENVPALAGTNATFSCLPGLIFRGPHRSTCIENGEWEPDPRNVECIGEQIIIRP